MKSQGDSSYSLDLRTLEASRFRVSDGLLVDLVCEVVHRLLEADFDYTNMGKTNLFSRSIQFRLEDNCKQRSAKGVAVSLALILSSNSFVEFIHCHLALGCLIPFFAIASSSSLIYCSVYYAHSLFLPVSHHSMVFPLFKEPLEFSQPS